MSEKGPDNYESPKKVETRETSCEELEEAQFKSVEARKQLEYEETKSIALDVITLDEQLSGSQFRIFEWRNNQVAYNNLVITDPKQRKKTNDKFNKKFDRNQEKANNFTPEEIEAIDIYQINQEALIDLLVNKYNLPLNPDTVISAYNIVVTESGEVRMNIDAWRHIDADDFKKYRLDPEYRKEGDPEIATYFFTLYPDGRFKFFDSRKTLTADEIGLGGSSELIRERLLEPEAANEFTIGVDASIPETPPENNRDKDHDDGRDE